jgi:5'-methylthioadenosine phosphorylase
MVTDYDAWRDAEAGVEAAEILTVMRANAETARRWLPALQRAAQALSTIDADAPPARGARAHA